MTEKYKLQQEDINSMDLTSDTLARLKQILPEVFSEGADGKPSIDVEKLKIALGGAVDVESDDKTRYSFNWSGKKQVQALANQPAQQHCVQAKPRAKCGTIRRMCMSRVIISK